VKYGAVIHLAKSFAFLCICPVWICSWWNRSSQAHRRISPRSSTREVFPDSSANVRG